MINDIYTRLLDAYGPQGWWPLVHCNGTNPTKTGVINGYHVGDYSYPQTRYERFEICLGCFLTQNTTWVSVEKALLQLAKINALTPEGIMTLDDETFKAAIAPAGYKNQKARYIKSFIPLFLTYDEHVPTREELLACVGIGPETADSILLYAFRQPEFVVDTYTKRIFAHLGICGEIATYDTVKKICHNSFVDQVDVKNDLVFVYQEFHALLVEHAKRHYRKKPYGGTCWLCE